MPGETAKHSIPASLKLFWQHGFFKVARTLADVAAELGRIRAHPKTQALNNALARADFLTRRGKKGHFSYIQKYAATVTTAPFSDFLPDELIKS